MTTNENAEHTVHTPDPGRGRGALFYAIAGGLVTSLIETLLHHIHLIWN